MRGIHQVTQIADMGEVLSHELVNQTRATWIQLVGGAVGLLVIYFTWKRLTATERTVEISQEGQITERFTRAIEQLGNEKLEVRLGGIYALERIARDSERDHWTIMEVLTAFVRENARWQEDQPTPRRAGPPRLRADIQTTLTVIGRRTRTYGYGEQLRLDLSETDLRNAYLGDAHLEGADLMATHLEGARLEGAHLETANLTEARLEEADLGWADLDEADSCGAHFEGADLTEARLAGANLFQAHLEGAYLIGADLEGATLVGAHLERANLHDAVGLTRKQLSQAITDDKTELPDYLVSDEQSTSTSG